MPQEAREFHRCLPRNPVIPKSVLKGLGLIRAARSRPKIVVSCENAFESHPRFDTLTDQAYAKSQMVLPYVVCRDRMVDDKAIFSRDPGERHYFWAGELASRGQR